MPISKKPISTEEARQAHWLETIRGSVHPNDWAVVKQQGDFAPPLDEPEPEADERPKTPEFHKPQEHKPELHKEASKPLPAKEA